jgi:hypothetical protein
MTAIWLYALASSDGYVMDARTGHAEFSRDEADALVFPTPVSAMTFLAIGCPSLARDVRPVPVRVTAIYRSRV